MYSWGDDTRAWKRPGAYDYGDANRGYLDKLSKAAGSKPRSYAAPAGPDLSLVDPKGKVLETGSKTPIIVATDVTGSMSTWPGEIFDRLPLMYQTLCKYKDDVEIAFAAIGDATCDRHPLQVADFDKGPALDAKLKALYPEGGGGGGARESYELFAHFVANGVKAPEAVSPMLIIFGDEGFYEHVDPGQVEHYLGSRPEAAIPAKQVWEAVGQHWNVYLLHKHYAGCDEEIVRQWKDALGPQKVIPVPSPERAVDHAIGLVAKLWGEFGDFKDSIRARHDDGTAKSVAASLRYVPDAAATKSMLTARTKGMKSKPLD